MIAVVRNGVCEIHNHLGHRLVTLPPVNIDEAVLQGKYVAVVLRNGMVEYRDFQGRLARVKS